MSRIVGRTLEMRKQTKNSNERITCLLTCSGDKDKSKESKWC